MQILSNQLSILLLSFLHCTYLRGQLPFVRVLPFKIRLLDEDYQSKEETAWVCICLYHLLILQHLPKAVGPLFISSFSKQTFFVLVPQLSIILDFIITALVFYILFVFILLKSNLPESSLFIQREKIWKYMIYVKKDEL